MVVDGKMVVSVRGSRKRQAPVLEAAGVVQVDETETVCETEEEEEEEEVKMVVEKKVKAVKVKKQKVALTKKQEVVGSVEATEHATPGEALFWSRLKRPVPLPEMKTLTRPCPPLEKILPPLEKIE